MLLKTTMCCAVAPLLSCIASLAAQAVQAPQAASKQREPGKTNVAIVVHEGVELLDFAGPGEVFAQAGFHVFTVAPTHDPIRSMGIVTVTPEFSIADAPRIDILVIPGGDTPVLLSDPAVMSWIKKTVADTEITMSVCTGAFTLAQNGLLDGLKATTHFSAIGGLRQQYPSVTVVTDQRFVDNGKIITTAGISAGIDGSLHVVARLLGDDDAWRAARSMQYAWEPPMPEHPTAEALAAREATRAWVTRDWPVAAAAYAAISAKNPDDVSALFRLGASQCNSGDNDAGIPNLQLAIKRGQNSPSDLATLARAFLVAKRYPDSITSYEQALTAGLKDHGTSRYNLACAYALGGRKAEALKSLELSLDEGFANLRLMETDEDLASLRTQEKFQALLKRLQSKNIRASMR